jgi:hypothetical protein
MRVSRILDKIDEGKSNVRLVTEECRSSMLLANSSEYKEGEAASCRGLTTRNNPYPFRSPEHWRWQEGLLGNCRPREWQVNPEPCHLPCLPIIDFLDDEGEAVVVAVMDLEPGAVLIGAS